MIWSFITFIVRKFDPETAHQISLNALKFGIHPRLKFIKIPTRINNLIFKNILGVAAGFDKNAEVIKNIHYLNFGFTEVGTITPLPQYGNAKPRVFRLEDDQAIINRNGFAGVSSEQALCHIGIGNGNNFKFGVEAEGESFLTHNRTND